MTPMATLREAQALLPGSRLVGDGAIGFDRVHSDTRTLRPGDLFVALRGERYDAHDFLAQARHAGAVAVLGERGLEAPEMPGLQVADSQQALGDLAAAWRARLQLPLIAVTGSNGKTTVTQMCGAILRAWLGDAALCTAGNLNNHIGVPLTLLRLRGHHRAAVVELGMNHPGEIARLAQAAKPTVALINNAQREHQEFFDGVEAVARENGSVIDVLPRDSGTLVVPALDACLPLWRRSAAERGVPRVWTFGLATGDLTARAEWHADAARWSIHMETPAGRIGTTLALAGRHNVLNALAAAACALAAGAPTGAVADGLVRFEPVPGRSMALRIVLHGRPCTLVDDSYNANPDSVRAAIDLLAGLPGPRWLLLGDMGEVGANGAAFHAEVGEYARVRGIDTVWAAGPLSTQVKATRHFADTAALVAALPQAPQATSVLVKGSRFMKMEQAVRALQRGAD
jgi:UDP-N-acetylmuramoyl-tripeptide--D-alanyl-D-alanine ligase